MSMYDLVIKNGWLIDGTGTDRRRADVGIEDGRVAEIDTDLGAITARRTIDAEGCIVSPGFVDIHTHYDAQVTWDPGATPSLPHGVTTVLGGNCGFSIAPLGDDAADYLVPMLSVVEGMSLSALNAGLKIEWQSFGEFLDCLEGRLAINAGFMVGHSAVRRTVMGERAVGHPCNERELALMVELVHDSIAGGAIGFSSSKGEAHSDHHGDPVPSRHASDAELLALFRAAGDHPGTSLEMIPTIEHHWDRATQLLLTALSVTARRPLNWNAVTISADPAVRASRFETSDIAAAAGGKVVGLMPSEPIFLRACFERPQVLESIPGWGDTMRLPLDERKKALGQESVRQMLAESAKAVARRWTDWPGYVVNDVPSPAMADLVGRSIQQIADEQEVAPFEAMCQLALAGDLLVGFAAPTIGGDDAGWERLVSLCRDPRVVVGASDAGAHLDQIGTFAMYTSFLGGAVRQRGLLSFEEAITFLSAIPARLYGLSNRGTLEVGKAADVVIFDPDSIGRGPIGIRSDLPGGAQRLYSEPEGVHEVLVNGTTAARNGVLSGATPGRTIRSGRDTVTPELGF
jgi:N-acyl-D-aspartate/D-glutamate deacylase